jgi:site-specific DNA recombinase
MTKRTALYARYSTDIQKDLSIDRQFADLEKAAARLGLELDKRHYYSDRAQSGSSLFERPGLTRDLMGAAKRKQFDVVLVEATDRLSRRRADLFLLADEFKFASVKIFLPTGEVSDLQLTFDGHQNEDFIAKLARRVRSGHDAIARDGLIPHAAAYGYECVPGQPGKKVINPEQAAIVLRIFTEYASRKSPRLIAADLMKDGIPSATGSPHWNYQSIVGGAGKKRGLIHNQLYVGVYLKNRYYNVKNPATGKTVTREADPSELIRVEIPELRIIPQDLWERVHAVRAERGHTKIGKDLAQRAVVPRKPHLLAGLLRCGECSGRMIINLSTREGRKGICCADAHNKQTCSHRKTYMLDKVTDLAVERLISHLTDPEALKERAKARALEYARLEKETGAARQAAQKQLDRLNVQISKLVRMLDDDDSDDLPREMLKSLKDKQIERKGLEERLRLLGAESNVTTLHPGAVQSFGKSIEKLQEMIQANPDDPACRMALGNVLDSVIVHPTLAGKPYEISLYARLSAVMGKVDLFDTPAHARENVAKSDTSVGMTEAGMRHHSGLYHTASEPIVLLGRWKAAA